METFIGIMIPFLGTTLGAACVFFMKKSLGDLVQRSLVGFAAGVMVQEQRLQEEEAKLKRERKIQEAMLDIKKKFGKNAILNGGSYLEGATAKERNKQIGGHKA